MEPASGSARLLATDGEATIRELLSGSLRLAGFEVMTAAGDVRTIGSSADSTRDHGVCG
jgi:hypothetical protein